MAFLVGSMAAGRHHTSTAAENYILTHKPKTERVRLDLAWHI